MSTALPGKAIIAEINDVSDGKQSVAVDRLIDHYHQLICTVGDVRDVENFFVRALQNQRLGDEKMASFLGITRLPQVSDEEGLPIASLDESVRQTLAPFAAQVLNHQQSLRQIAASLRHLHQQDKVKVLEEADMALRNGMSGVGRDRLEDLRDALRLLRTIQADPVSGRDYYVWFHIGWILWQLDGNLTEAEEAFYQAARLSAQAGDLLHNFSLRHQAYMQYLQNKHKLAHSTIGKGLTRFPNDAEILYDAARYAARAERTAEAIAHLDRCFDTNPLVFVYALNEEDFQETGIAPQVRSLLNAKRDTALGVLQTETARWRRALAAAHEAADQSGASIQVPGPLGEEGITELAAFDSTNADYLALQNAIQRITGKSEAVRESAKASLESAINVLDAEADKYQRQIDQLKRVWEHWRGQVKWLEKEAKEAGFSLQPGGPMEAIKLRLQKKLDRVREARVNYEAYREHLADAVKEVKDKMPGLEKNMAGVKERRAKIETARDWLTAQDI